MTNAQYYQALHSEGYTGFVAIRAAMATTPEGGDAVKLKTIQTLIDMYFGRMVAVPVPNDVPDHLKAVNIPLQPAKDKAD